MLSNTSSKPSVLPYKELEESVWKKDICAGCRACITICPGNTLAYDNTENKPYQNTPCVDCKACVDVCPRMPANYGAFLSTEII
ncbi:MAG TPA: 4Fe-4S dicluster domain-containing protein, partial [Methanocella sp.]|nr:4Fe-4S dicluster domain-containing protein [Methanocella sp.]